MKKIPIRNEDKIITSVNLTCEIKNGTGTFNYPESLKHCIYETNCQCHAIEIFTPIDKTLYLFSNVSCYLDQNHNFKPNLLQMFHASKPYVEFSGKTINSMNVVPNSITITVNEWRDDQFNIVETFNGLLAIELFGYKAA